MGTRRKTNMSEAELRDYHNTIHFHNSLYGRLRHARSGLNAIAGSRTCSPDAQAKADHIVKLIDELDPLVKARHWP